jgi:hypothetical protein
MPSAPPLAEIEAFIARWSGTAQAERANYARFIDLYKRDCFVRFVPSG